MLYLLVFPLAGIVAGFLAGLLGLGGGIIIVPCLVWLLPHIGIDYEVSVHIAIATSMATVIVTQIISVRSHTRYFDVTLLWQTAKKLWPGIIFGAIAGTVIADFLNSKELALLFGVVIFLLAVKVALDRGASSTAAQLEYPWKLPNQPIIMLVTTVIGSLSSLLGISGGAFTVPFLQNSKLPLRLSIAMSACCGLPLSIVATLSYIVVGLNDTPHIKWSTGYLYWPAFLGIVCTSMFLTPLGVKCAHRIPQKVLKWLFVFFLVFVSTKMVFF
jgi:uncharacterized protein